MPIITQVGTETLANSSTFENQSQPVITPLANGQYVVVWVDYTLTGAFNLTNTANADIRARIFNADGTPAGAEFTVNTTTAAAQVFPSVTTLSDGNFLVAWQDGLGTLIGGAGAPNAAIRAQEFTASGTPVGSEFIIGTAEQNYFPSISAVAGGGFVAAWQEGTSGAYVAQVFNSSNAAVGSQFTIDNTNLPAFGRVVVTSLANGNIAAAWTTGLNDPTGGHAIRIFSPTGIPVTGEFSSSGSSDANNSTIVRSITSLASGGFAVARTWSNTLFNTNAAHLNMYDASGTISVHNELAVVNSAGSLGPITLAPLQNGGVIATWSSGAPAGDTDGSAIRYAAFNGIGNPMGTGGQVNATAAGSQSQPSVAVLSTGDIVFAWADPSASLGDTSGSGIHTRRYDYDSANQNPIAINDVISLQSLSLQATFPTHWLTENDNDLDGDEVILTSISNVQGGTVTFDANQQSLAILGSPGSQQITFSYTISDGLGGTATAQATILQTRDDNLTVRGGTSIVDFLANDGLTARPDGYSISLNLPANIMSVFYSTLGTGLDTDLFVSTGYSLTGSAYAILPVGQTRVENVTYNVFNPVTSALEYSATITLTYQGWAQTGGTGYDYLVGGPLADHLIGGTGAANALQGGAGDDWYTVQAAGDSIIEFTNEGLDVVYTPLTVLTLPNNVENLIFVGAPNTDFVGLGNELNNVIAGGTGRDTIFGYTGNDRLQGGGGAGFENTLIGGTGDDTYVVSLVGDSTIELPGEGIDTVRTTISIYGLQANIENLTLTNTGPHLAAVGNDLDNVITGNTGLDEIFGRDGNDTLIGGSGAANTMLGQAGNDTYNVSAVGDSVIEFVGEGTDTVNASVASFTLGANLENLNYTGTATFTGIGNELANSIAGGAGADFLSGLDGNDILTGNSGADILLGGAGNDEFRYLGGETGIDRILDFTSGQDRIALALTGFTRTATVDFVSGAGATATSSNSTFLYDPTTGIISYDADGNGAGGPVQIAQVNIGTTVVASDFTFV